MIAIALPPVTPAIEITLSSHGMSKGIGQTDAAQAIIRPSLKSGNWRLTGQWKNVENSAARGEAQLGLGWSGKLAGFDLGASAAHKWRTGIKQSGDNRAFEYAANIGRAFGKTSLRANAVYSPDDFGSTRTSLFVEAGPTFDLGQGFKASALVGRRHRAGGLDYWAYSAGVAKTIGKATFDLRAYDNDHQNAGPEYPRRLVASVKLSI